MSEWPVVPAGSVTTQRKDIVVLEPGVEYRTMGVRWYGKGAYDRGSGTTETIKAKRLFRARSGDFVFNRIDTQNGAFDVVPEALDGALASNEFPLYIADPGRLLAAFLHLYFQQMSVLAQIDALRAGSEGRSRWKEADFEAWRIPLPPPAEQRRIVEVMAAVDAQLEALAEEAESAMKALAPMTESLLSADDDWPVMSLGEVGEFIRGKRFTKADYTSSGLGVIHYSHIHTHFGPVATGVAAHVSEEARHRLRLAYPGDVVIAATSEDMAGVGKATVWLGSEGVAVHDDAQIYRHRLDPLFATFIFSSPAFQNQKVQYAGGTKVTRISGADLAKIKVPIPPVEVQSRIGEALAEQVGHVSRVRGELADLRRFRSTLLTALLNQEIEIPEFYDDLLETV